MSEEVGRRRIDWEKVAAIMSRGQCEYCGGDPDECGCFDDGDDLPLCHDCGGELDCNGFCAECDGDPWE